MSFLRQYLVAVQCYTRMPVGGHGAQGAGLSPDTLRASAAHFPGVGLMVGLLACIVFALLVLALPASPYAPLAAAVASTIATVLLTGGTHEDGLARVADGLGGSAPHAAALEIMKDPRIGSRGTLALLLALAAKISLLTMLAAESPTAVLAALLAGHVLSRFWALLLVRTLPLIGDAAGDEPLAGRIDSRGLGLGAAWCIVPLALALMSQGPGFATAGLLFSGAASWWMWRIFTRRLQGFTPQGLGATQQICEIAFYLGAAIGFGLG